MKPITKVLAYPFLIAFVLFVLAFSTGIVVLIAVFNLRHRALPYKKYEAEELLTSIIICPWRP